LGVGVWGFGYLAWAPTPKPQSPIPNKIILIENEIF